MTRKRIITIGLQLASTDIEHAIFRSKTSLLDWDIIVFKPDVGDFLEYADTFQGKPSLGADGSFKIKEDCEHWRRELKQAVETGKTVIVYLSHLQEFYVDTGQRTYSGTGRNRKTISHVDLYNNYNTIPASLSPVTASGKSMKLVARIAEMLTPYWAEFESVSQYEVILTDTKIPSCLVTKSADKAVGAIYRSKTSAGSLLLLPDINFMPDSFVTKKGGNWTSAALAFAGKFISSIVSLDKALQNTSEVTPQPNWADDGRFKMGTEDDLQAQLLEAERQVENACPGSTTVRQNW